VAGRDLVEPHRRVQLREQAGRLREVGRGHGTAREAEVRQVLRAAELGRVHPTSSKRLPFCFASIVTQFATFGTIAIADT
jgi:hypothetical protein